MKRLWLAIPVLCLVVGGIVYFRIGAQLWCGPVVAPVEAEIREDFSDTDGDGLSDQWETGKYGTDPRKRDSDGDGVEDSDWEERREYTATIRVVVDLRPPYRVEDMNDFYQDARYLEAIAEDVGRVEIILYPEAKPVLEPLKYQPLVNEYIRPTYTKNYSEKMQKSVRRKIRGKKTDLEVVESIIATIKTGPFFVRYFGLFTYMDQVRDLKCNTSLPLHFNLYRDESGNMVEENFPTSEKYTKQELLDRVFFADRMYFGGTVGACSSSAILRGAMLRAVGIPEKTVVTIPLYYFYEDEEVEIRMDEKYKIGYPEISKNSSMVADHFYNEVFICNQWVRVDNKVDTGIMLRGENKPYVKILECHDTVDFNFVKYWNYVTWKEKRPYKYLFIIEQGPKYGNS